MEVNVMEYERPGTYEASEVERKVQELAGMKVWYDNYGEKVEDLRELYDEYLEMRENL